MKTYLTPGEQWDQTARLFVRTSNLYHPQGPYPYFLDYGVGIVRRACRWTRAGDVLIVEIPNGDDRWGFTGVTSKGRRLCGYYQTTDRKPGGRIKVVELPGELAHMPPTAPAVRQYIVDSLRAVNLAACDGTQETGR